jgi:hypothetical protein
MSLTLIIVVNVAFDLTIAGILAFLVSHAHRWASHGSVEARRPLESPERSGRFAPPLTVARLRASEQIEVSGS